MKHLQASLKGSKKNLIPEVWIWKTHQSDFFGEGKTPYVMHFKHKCMEFYDLPAMEWRKKDRHPYFEEPLEFGHDKKTLEKLPLRPLKKSGSHLRHHVQVLPVARIL